MNGFHIFNGSRRPQSSLGGIQGQGVYHRRSRSHLHAANRSTPPVQPNPIHHNLHRNRLYHQLTHYSTFSSKNKLKELQQQKDELAQLLRTKESEEIALLEKMELDRKMRERQELQRLQRDMEDLRTDLKEKEIMEKRIRDQYQKNTQEKERLSLERIHHMKLELQEKLHQNDNSMLKIKTEQEEQRIAQERLRIENEEKLKAVEAEKALERSKIEESQKKHEAEKERIAQLELERLKQETELLKSQLQDKYQEEESLAKRIGDEELQKKIAKNIRERKRAQVAQDMLQTRMSSQGQGSADGYETDSTDASLDDLKAMIIPMSSSQGQSMSKKVGAHTAPSTTSNTTSNTDSKQASNPASTIFKNLQGTLLEQKQNLVDNKDATDKIQYMLEATQTLETLYQDLHRMSSSTQDDKATSLTSQLETIAKQDHDDSATKEATPHVQSVEQLAQDTSSQHPEIQDKVDGILEKLELPKPSGTYDTILKKETPIQVRGNLDSKWTDTSQVGGPPRGSSLPDMQNLDKLLEEDDN